jgi:hypothetical protein
MTKSFLLTDSRINLNNQTTNENNLDRSNISRKDISKNKLNDKSQLNMTKSFLTNHNKSSIINDKAMQLSKFSKE